MRIFKNIWFTRFADKEGIEDARLKDMVKQLEAGQADAELGGEVYKVRIARSGAGKSGGYRVIVFFKSGERTFYVYGFAKSSRANIGQKELKDYKELAKIYFAMSEKEIEAAILAGKFTEI
jgi:hypothetical protein